VSKLTQALCSYHSHAENIRLARESGRFGEMDCPDCRRPLQLGHPRCPHGNIIWPQGYNLCEICPPKAAPHRRVSQERIDALIPPIDDRKLRAHVETGEAPSDASLHDLQDGD
jgi:hypothetical protein